MKIPNHLFMFDELEASSLTHRITVHTAQHSGNFIKDAVGKLLKPRYRSAG